MANLNKTLLVGRMTDAPEVRELSNDNKVAKFTIATNRVYFDKDRNKQEETDFIDVEIFGNKAGVLEQYGRKGKELFVEGRLKQDKWQDKETGQNRSKIIVRADDFQFLGAPDAGGSESRQESTPKAAPKFNKGQKKDKDVPF